MAVYVVAQGRVDDRALLDQYVKHAVRSIGSAGGKIIGFDESAEVIEGSVEHPRTVIVEFESRAAFDAWYHSPEYQDVIQMRFDSAPGTLVLVDGIAR
jgi:uncharacterized protein (DUF1330 family)